MTRARGRHGYNPTREDSKEVKGNSHNQQRKGGIYHWLALFRFQAAVLWQPWSVCSGLLSRSRTIGLQPGCGVGSSRMLYPGSERPTPRTFSNHVSLTSQESGRRMSGVRPARDPNRRPPRGGASGIIVSPRWRATPLGARNAAH